MYSGAQFEGDSGKILALGAEISPYIGLREKWEFKFASCQHIIDKLCCQLSPITSFLFYLMLIVCVLSYFVIKIS